MHILNNSLLCIIILYLSFLKTCRRDGIKYLSCHKRDIKLIVIPYDVKDLEGWIMERLLTYEIEDINPLDMLDQRDRLKCTIFYAL